MIILHVKPIRNVKPLAVWFNLLTESSRHRKSYSTNHTPRPPSYIHHIGKEPLVYRTVGQQLAISAAKYGDRDAIISYHEKKRLTFSEVLDKATRLAAGFHKLGLKKGDRIAIWAPNTMQWYLTMMGAAKAGLISVTVNPAYQAPEMAYSLKKVNMNAIFASESFKSANYYKTLRTIIPELETSKKDELKSKDFKNLASIIIDSENSLHGTYNLEEILNLASETEVQETDRLSSKIQPDDACNIQFTSGTTGKPKAAVLSHFNIINNGIHIGYRNELDKKHHIICVQNPFFHVYGLVVAITAALAHGSTVLIPAPNFNPVESLHAILNEKCTIIYGTPTMHVDLVARQKELMLPIRTVDFAVTGGAPCPTQLIKDMKQLFGLHKFKTIYGMTETTAIAFISLVEETEYHYSQTVGHILEHLEAKVVNTEGEIVPMGTPGELYTRGYNSMLGYYNDEAQTKEIICNDRWLRTGDQFILHENGYGEVVGRFKDMIIRGGENIFPKEIEDFLCPFPGIKEIQVVGVPDDRLGEEVCAFIRINDSVESINENDIRAYCKGKLAHYKIPRYFRFIDSFPRTTSGKIQKFKLKELFVESK